MVTLFLILTVGWFIYAFIRFTQELILGLREAAAEAICTDNIDEVIQDSYKTNSVKND